MIECSECSHPIQIDDTFCENCGAPQPNQPNQPHQRWSDPNPPTITQKSEFKLPPGLGTWRTLRWLITIIVAIFLLGGLCGRLLFPREVVSERLKVVTPSPTSTATNTPGPSPTPTMPNTATPTNTPTLTPTPHPTTVPGTILEPGLSWREDNLVLRMELVAIQPKALAIDLVLTNVGDETILFESKPDMFRAVSNLGDIIGPNRDAYGYFTVFSGFTGGSLSLKPGERLDLAKNAPFRYNLASSDISEIVVEVVGLSRIDRAQWRVKIPH